MSHSDSKPQPLCLNAGRFATVMTFPLSGGWQLQVNGVTEEEYEELANRNIAPDFERLALHPGFVTGKWRISSTGARGDNFPPTAQATIILNCLSQWGFELQNNGLPLAQQGTSNTTGLLWHLRKRLE